MKIFIVFLMLGFSTLVWAKDDSKRGTNFEFNDAMVKGRYHSAGEGMAVVEDEKKINDLLALRKNFKDRVRKNVRVQK